MPNLIPQYAFSAGEVSPEFFGRTDLTKYPLGVQLAENFLVGTLGGLYTRAGSHFVGPSKAGVKLFRFRATNNDYLLELGDLYLRIIRNGGYLIEPSVAITGVTNTSPAIVTAAGHGYSTGDWVYLTSIGGMTEINQRYLVVGVTTLNTFELLLPEGGNVDAAAYGAYTSGGVSSRVYTVPTTWNAVDLPELRGEQEFDDVTFTHLAYPPRRLTFMSDTNWTLTDVVIGSTVTAPATPVLSPSGAGTAGMAFSVTAVVNGVESLGSAYGMNGLSVNYTATAGSMKVTWPAVTGASFYNVYRSLVLPTGADISLAQDVGYLGRAFAGLFVDTNITPDFTHTPPQGRNPFADSAITSIAVTAGGVGYTKTSTVTVTGGGSGFVGYPVVNSSGAIISVVLVNGGSGYTAPAVSFAGGTGGAATATVGAATGNHPRVYKKFQQRGVYAGTVNLPMTLEGSKPGARDNFNVSSIAGPGDAYTFQLDASVVQPIVHLHSMRSGLLIFTEESITKLGAAKGAAVTARNALAEPEAYNGVGGLAEPISIGLDVVFPQRLGGALSVMAYTVYTSSFHLENLSLLSKHLFGAGKAVTRLEYAEAPGKLLYCLREDGVLLTLTYDRAEKLYGWAHHVTRGRYLDCTALVENGEWVLYTLVERKIGGNWVKYVERTLGRDKTLAEDFWCVDAGLDYPHETPAANLTPSALSGVGVTFTASASIFTPTDVGKIMYLGNGKAEITGFVSGTQVIGTVLRTLTTAFPDASGLPSPSLAGNWSMVRPTTSVSNLQHLEGETVSILADGNAYTNLTVTGGAVTWNGPAASKVIVGLPYTCRIKTLPIASPASILESRRKDFLGLGMQLYKTRGLAVGEDFTHLVELKDQVGADWGDSIELRSSMTYVPINTGWAEDGSIAIEQSYPLPAAVLSIIYDVESGDT